MVVPADATSQRRVLTLSGTRSASLAVTFARPVTFHDGNPTDETGPTISGTADVAGYLLTDVSRTRVLAGVLTTTRLRPDGAPARLAIGDGTARVPAGRYVLTLVASSQTEVRIPVDGLSANVAYRPVTPVPLKVADNPLDPALGTEASGRAPISVTARTVTLLGVAFTTTAQDGTGMFCLTWRGKSCPGVAGSAFAYATSGLPQPMQDQAFATLVRPHPSRKGAYDASWSLSLNGVYTSARGVAILIG